MQSNAATPQEYVDALPKERGVIVQKLRDEISENLPEGFSEEMNYGMIGYVVPHALYPAGYHVNPKLPLPFMYIANQKHFIAVYHMGIYVEPRVGKWFAKEYEKLAIGKLDMGKSCIRFKKLDTIPYKLIGQLCTKMTVDEWIQVYEKEIK
jgi:uncharacterized protein YdhG (YjbR/CyaY superfamily)